MYSGQPWYSQVRTRTAYLTLDKAVSSSSLSIEGISVAVLALLEADVDVDAAALLLGEGEVCSRRALRL